MTPSEFVPAVIVVNAPNWLTFLLKVSDEPVAPVEARLSVVVPKREEPETTTLPVVVVSVALEATFRPMLVAVVRSVAAV